MTVDQKAAAWDALKSALVAASSDPLQRFEDRSRCLGILGMLTAIEKHVEEADK